MGSPPLLSSLVKPEPMKVSWPRQHPKTHCSAQFPSFHCSSNWWSLSHSKLGLSFTSNIRPTGSCLSTTRTLSIGTPQQKCFTTPPPSPEQRKILKADWLLPAG